MSSNSQLGCRFSFLSVAVPWQRGIIPHAASSLEKRKHSLSSFCALT